MGACVEAAGMDENRSLRWRVCSLRGGHMVGRNKQVKEEDNKGGNALWGLTWMGAMGSDGVMIRKRVSESALWTETGRKGRRPVGRVDIECRVPGVGH